ncbi:unnamed protein product, partial [Pylaiella littoralis]
SFGRWWGTGGSEGVVPVYCTTEGTVKPSYYLSLSGRLVVQEIYKYGVNSSSKHQNNMIIYMQVSYTKKVCILVLVHVLLFLLDSGAARGLKTTEIVVMKARNRCLCLPTCFPTYFPTYSRPFPSR